MAVNGIGYSQTYYYNADTKKTTSKNAAGEVFLEEIPEGYHKGIPHKGAGAPYSYLANEQGVVEYNDVVFTLNQEKKWLCLGDMTNLDDVIRIPLTEGGCLMVNRDNIDQLGHAIGMFSPEDINRILRALKLDAKVQEMEKEIEEMEDGIGKSSSEQNAENTKEAQKAAQANGKDGGFNGYAEDSKADIIRAWKEEILEKVRRGETEASFALGGSSFTTKQWDKLMNGVDKAIDDMKESVEEEKEDQAKAEQEKKLKKKEEDAITMEMLQELLGIKFEEDDKMKDGKI